MRPILVESTSVPSAHERNCTASSSFLPISLVIVSLTAAIRRVLETIAVSPGFTPRPSLSASSPFGGWRTPRVSPGFTPRPSLSEVRLGRVRARHAGVAGVHAPAFVERIPPDWAGSGLDRVSPGFTPRPSLSAGRRGFESGGVHVSPGFTPRPSLSEEAARAMVEAAWGVAGVHAPAFVERGPTARRLSYGCGVAGVHAPAFVERARMPVARATMPPCVAGVHAPAFVERWKTRLRKRRRPCVAGVHAPAFVER